MKTWTYSNSSKVWSLPVPSNAFIYDRPNSSHASVWEPFWEYEEVEAYLEHRGVRPETAAIFELGYCRDLKSTQLRRRLLYPILKYGLGEVIGYQGRLLPGDPDEEFVPKAWHNVPDTARHLFGLYQAVVLWRSQQCSTPFRVVEGPMDAIIGNQYGIPTVAVMRASISTEQARLLACFTNEVTVLTDGGKHGEEGGLKSCQVLYDVGIDPYISLGLADDEDPADLGPDIVEYDSDREQWLP